ncbi:NF038120 family PEP-CTERM protein [Paucibacter sp. APW11]|uniref:NF038120 family PEP-CTERM protein n=1 Tax=Roseateles aquae TaxID=3077235 RepID=A0ABU3PFP5_9BURK|nr:NF038120 family PEP-CTERM protein [Paucibacter sp. APW11]MDT9000913.1 NF038120 family PEP-CTERM protein [Paucibacter sp. APW11]
MKLGIKHALALAAVAACTAASAGVVTFEGLDPSIYGGGDAFSSGGASLTVLGSGFNGAIVNGSDVNTCTTAACPTGNGSNYFAGLNDGGLNVAGGGGITLRSLDFGFIAPLPVPGLTGFGRLVLEGIFADGSVYNVSEEFSGADASGNFGFSHWNVGAGFGNNRFASVNVFACLYTTSGSCVNPAGNQAQFAVDNLDYVIPEPGSLALVGLSLAGLAAVRRRRQSV